MSTYHPPAPTKALWDKSSRLPQEPGTRLPGQTTCRRYNIFLGVGWVSPLPSFSSFPLPLRLRWQENPLPPTNPTDAEPRARANSSSFCARHWLPPPRPADGQPRGPIASGGGEAARSAPKLLCLGAPSPVPGPPPLGRLLPRSVRAARPEPPGGQPRLSAPPPQQPRPHGEAGGLGRGAR